jgi:hypothetical protein
MAMYAWFSRHFILWRPFQFRFGGGLDYTATMDKPRRLAAVFMALSEADTPEEYAKLRDEYFAGLPDRTSELCQLAYDDLRFIFAAKKPKVVNLQETAKDDDPALRPFD